MRAARNVTVMLALATAGVCVFIAAMGNRTYAFEKRPISTQNSAGSASDTPSVPVVRDWKALFPDDPSKTLVITTCSACHGLEQIVIRRGDKGFWSDIVYTMVSNGADIQDEDVPKVVKYFSTYFDDSKPVLKVPININTATADVFKLLPPIADHAEDIVKKRDDLKGFQKVDDLLQVNGLTKEQLDKVRGFLAVGH